MTAEAGGDDLERFLPSLLDLGLVPPAIGVAAARGRRRVRAEFGDFAGHVPYSPGEDLRFLDWSALARTGQRVLRRFDEHRHEQLELILDLSASMRPRLGSLRRLARLYVYLGLHRLDSVQLTLLEAGAARVLRFEGAEAWAGARAVLADLEVGGSRGFDDLVDVLGGRARGFGRVLVSDLQPEPAAARVLARAAHEGHRLVCVFPRLPLEAGEVAAMPSGPCLLRDGETGRGLEVTMTAGLAAAFVDEQREWEGRMAALCREHGHELIASRVPAATSAARIEPWLPFLSSARKRRR